PFVSIDAVRFASPALSIDSLSAPKGNKSWTVTIGTFRFSTTATLRPFLSVVSFTAGSETPGAGPGLGRPVCAITDTAPNARSIAGRNDFDSFFMILFIAFRLRFFCLVVIKYNSILVFEILLHDALDVG